jgi:arylsulfatase A-like enzyme
MPFFEVPGNCPRRKKMKKQPMRVLWMWGERPCSPNACPQWAAKASVAWLALLGVLIATAKAPAQARRPNIVLVMSDDHGYGDLGVHGNDKVQTPTLDRFAREGVELTRFYVSPVCSPTRASLMTSRYHYRTGIIHTSRGGALMHGDEVTIAEILRDAGYRTGIFGKWHLGDCYPMRPQDQGFEESLVHTSGGIAQPPDADNQYENPRLLKNGQPIETRGYCTDVFFDAALKFIRETGDQPFFAYIPTNVPHTPLEVSEAAVEPFRKLGLDNTTARIYAMVKNLDDNFARLLKALDERKLRENTLVIFMTDNGPQQNRYNAGLRERKSSVYEGGIRVPFFIQWPARLVGKRQIDRIAAHIDVLPTLLAAAGLELPASAKIDGRNLLPLLTGATPPSEWPERTLFLQCHRGLTPKLFQNAAAITQRYKLVAYPHTFNREDLLPSQTDPVLELYDLEADRGEHDNLAREKPEVVAALRRQYEDWFADVWRSRQFTSGIIHLGNDAAKEVLLCLYQDASWKFNEPFGWLVNIERGGRYELTLRGEDQVGPGHLVVSWQGREVRQPLKAGERSATFSLAAGQGTIDIQFLRQDSAAPTPAAKNTAGDVRMKLLTATP